MSVKLLHTAAISICIWEVMWDCYRKRMETAIVEVSPLKLDFLIEYNIND